jgi:hypothetical protein
MHQKTLFSALSLVLVTAACSGAPADEPPTAGSGGATAGPSTSASGPGGQGTTSVGQGGGGGAGGEAMSYPIAIGAAYPNGGDARIVLIDATGTRGALFNPSAGTFEPADDIDELLPGLPIDDIVAVARTDVRTVLFDGAGSVTIYDHAQASFSAPAPLATALPNIPFTAVGAAFGLNSQIFVFDAAGTSYSAYNQVTTNWSPVYSFATDFGGGGAPIASVGAAYLGSDDNIVLFDKSGTNFCMYGGGTFSSDFDIEELGDGNLSFDDASND